MFDIPAREIATSKRTVSDVHVKKSVGVVSTVLKSRNRKLFAEAADTASFVDDSSPDFPGPVSVVPIAEDELVEEDSSSSRRDL